MFPEIDKPKTRLTKLNRKIKENSKYELTLTECYNLCLIFKISMQDFLQKYILPL
jgi:hypothetical protein